MKVTVVVSPNSTININAKGSKVAMQNGGTLIGPYVECTNEANAVVSISTNPVTSPGTYSFVCHYRQNNAASNTPIYEGSGDNLTFTVINEHNMEGYFTAVVCRCISTGCVFGVDSVIVSGTFKGDRIN